MMLRRTAWSACAALCLVGAGSGCEFIASVDRGAMTGAGGGSGDGDSALGIGGSSGSGGTDVTDASVDTGAPGTGGDMLGAGGAGGAGASGGGGGETGGGTVGGGGSGGGGGTTVVTDSGFRDAEGGSPTDAPIDGGSCGGTVPAGWTLTVYSPSATPCPTGYPAANDHPIIGTPVPQTGACTCPCVPGTQPTCTRGPLVAAISPGSGNDACVPGWLAGTTITPGTAAGISACVAADGQDFDNASAAAIPVQSGTCTSGTPLANPAALTKPPQHYCDVPAASVADVCAGVVPSGYNACITIANVSAMCPSGSPYTRLFRVQNDATLNCGTCGQCTLTASCSNQTLIFFNDTGCGTEVGRIAANNTCQGTNPNEDAVNSIRYEATMSPPLCSAGTSTATAVPVGPRTICCR